MITLRLSIFSLLLLLSPISSANNQQVPPLVETSWLSENLDNVVILDVRADNKSFTSKPIYKTNKKTNKQSLARVGGHIHGANLVLYKNVRGEQKIGENTIKYMTTSKTNFESIVQHAGANQDSHIVILTNAESLFDLTMASRMYWQVKYFGHDLVSILNGGTAQWLLDGREITTNPTNSTIGNWKALSERKQLLATSNQVHTAIQENNSQLVDVREIGQYLGTYKSGKVKQKGHIPSAKLFPVSLLSSRNTPVKFSSKEELENLSKALGVNSKQDLITYCNSGHLASGGWFVFHELLNNSKAKLYDGSMHQWTLEGRPVVTMKIE
ncbi:MAG: rhodanese-like domain-containing protein [Gammaproteobacteria bacterium]|nr:rhodanese-like domain-containing protein [Gammaproteobacteria bacterium]